MQEAFLRAFKAWPRYRPEKPAEAWIYQIAINVAISYRRRARLRTIGELLRRLGRPGPGADPADAAGRAELIAALSALPPHVAADFVLRYHHGYNNREIAALEGVSERTIGARLAQARLKLARRLGPEWLGEVPTSATRNVVIPRGRSGASDV